MATRYECPYGVSAMCESGNGKPPRDRCRACRGEFRIEHGKWAVSRWRADGVYRESDVVRFYESLPAATRYVNARPGSNLIVRFHRAT